MTASFKRTLRARSLALAETTTSEKQLKKRDENHAAPCFRVFVFFVGIPPANVTNKGMQREARRG